MAYPRSHSQDSNSGLVIPQSLLYMPHLELGAGSTLPGLTAGIRPFFISDFGRVHPGTVNSRATLWLSLVAPLHDIDV